MNPDPLIMAWAWALGGLLLGDGFSGEGTGLPMKKTTKIFVRDIALTTGIAKKLKSQKAKKLKSQRLKARKPRSSKARKPRSSKARKPRS